MDEVKIQLKILISIIPVIKKLFFLLILTINRHLQHMFILHFHHISNNYWFDMFWYELPQKWGRVGTNFGQKFQIFKSFIIPKIQAQLDEYGNEEIKFLLHI